ncbi:MAG: hypothetical protein HQL26_06885 [Candidatus Omnitrophica bacterium]|nr:hypothetical protein [Candidatus Omnitrophota bacterium]
MDEDVLFKWDHKIKMLFNPILWGSYLACFGIPAILLGIGFSVTGNIKVALFFPVALMAFFAVLWFIVGIVIDIGGGFSASFVITSRGIYFSSGPRAKKAADMAAVIGAFAGSASGAGAGLLARAEQDTSVTWDKIKKIKVRKGMHYIFVRGSFGNKPIGLYCNKENFDSILSLVQSKVRS